MNDLDEQCRRAWQSDAKAHKRGPAVSVSSSYAKRAVKRDPTAPVGQPAELYWLDCGCGRCVPVDFPEGGDAACDCGVIYSARGWVRR